MYIENLDQMTSSQLVVVFKQRKDELVPYIKGILEDTIDKNEASDEEVLDIFIYLAHSGKMHNV